MSSNTSSSSSTLPIVIGLVAILGIALAIALLGGDDTPASDFDLGTVATPTIEGEPVATGAVGVAAPRVSGEALLGEGDHEIPAVGDATMIVFLAHWCPHCNDEVPVINQWLAEGGLPEGTQVRAVATGIDPTAANYPPDTWLQERDWAVPTLIDPDGSIADAYGVNSYPYWVFVDADGTVVGHGGAQTQADMAAIAAQLAER